MYNVKGITVIMILCIVFCSLVGAQTCEEVGDPKPVIEVNFDESVTILGTSFTKDGKAILYSGPIAKTNENKSFEYTVEELLEEDKYTFTIAAEDVFGNLLEQEKCFDLKISPIKITLKEPSFGYSNTNRFNITVESDRLAVCRYSFSSQLPYISMAPFNELGASRLHTSEILISEVGVKQVLYVKCKTSSGWINDDPVGLNLTVDTSAPSIQEVYIQPGSGNQVTDYPLQTTLTVVTDDATRCRFSKTKTAYDEMELVFDNYHAGKFSTINTRLLTGLKDIESYSYNLICENAAGLVLDKQFGLLTGMSAYTFDVNLGVAQTLEFTKPEKSLNTTSVELELRTNKNAICQFSDDDTIFTRFQNTGETVHSQSLQSITTDGEYTYYGKCLFVTSGVVKETSYTFFVDTEGPEVDNITSVNTCNQDEVSAKWGASDSGSGVESYYYAVDSGTTEILPFTHTSQDSAIYNLDNATGSYYFRVKAVDNAGNVGLELRSSEISVSNPTASICEEKDPPTGIVTTEAVGSVIYAILTCQDSGSGCNTNAMFYSTSTTETCTATTAYTDKVEVEQNNYFCWKVSDNAGNAAIGQQKIEIKDSDNDTVSDINDRCPNTPIGESVDSDGCSDTQLDSDGDGVNDALDLCPGTQAGFTVDSDGCALDADADGMPDSYEDDNGFDKNDPADADQDADADGYTNLDEYQQGSDPNDPNDPGVSVDLDTDGDGVSDSYDRCPDTPEGEIVDSDGCSQVQLDADEDLLPDEWEAEYCGGDCDPDADDDSDGLNNFEEYEQGTDPFNPDSDEDGYSDGDEVYKYNTDPTDELDKPDQKFIPMVMLILGSLLALGGAGYLGYKQFYVKKQGKPVMSTEVGRQQQSVQQTKQEVSQQNVQKSEVKEVQRMPWQEEKPKLTAADMQRIKAKEALEKKRKSKFAKRFKLFDRFKETGEEEKIRKIRLPDKQKVVRKVKVEKAPVREAVKEIVKEKEIAKVAEKPVRKLSEVEKLKQITERESAGAKLRGYREGAITKGHLKKLITADSGQAQSIFKKLEKVNKGKERETHFSKLRGIISDSTKKGDVFKQLPGKMVPESDKEAELFKKLRKVIGK